VFLPADRGIFPAPASLISPVIETPQAAGGKLRAFAGMAVALRLVMDTREEGEVVLDPGSRGLSPSMPVIVLGAMSLDDHLMEVERRLIALALTASAGNKSKAAELLKIKRSTLGDRINRCGIGASPESPDTV